MNMKANADAIYALPTDTDDKIKQLRELLLDCLNEMEAQEQNMRPEIQHQLSEGYRVAKNYLRELETLKD